ncbi:MAG TPA: NINE protein [Ktedonobacterales bacterium]|nr:NINE protein [Ktedonobacterales bacterium]
MSVDVSDLSAHLPDTLRRSVRTEYRLRAKSATTAFILCFFLGIFGIHRFYLGQMRQGLLRLVLSPLIIPGLIWEVIDLFHIDHEVYQDNLALAELLIAQAALSTSSTALAVATAPQGATPRAHPDLPSIDAPAQPPHVTTVTPISAFSDTDESPTPPSDAPPIWPLAAGVTAAELAGASAVLEPSATLTPVAADHVELPIAGDNRPDITPEMVADAARAAATEAPFGAMHLPGPFATVDGAALAPVTSLQTPAPDASLAVGEHEREALPALDDAPRMVSANGAELSPAAFSPTATELPIPQGSLPPRPLDFTDRAAVSDPPLVADIGEDTGTRLRVVLPPRGEVLQATPPAQPEPEIATGPTVPLDVPLNVPLPAEASSLVFVADPAAEQSPATENISVGPSDSALAASTPQTALPPASTPSQELSSPSPATEPAVPADPRADASGDQTRMVKRVRVVRRLVVDGKVVHEAIAEQVVEPGVDTAATAMSLREALRGGDGPRIAALTAPLRPLDSEQPAHPDELDQTQLDAAAARAREDPPRPA